MKNSIIIIIFAFLMAFDIHCQSSPEVLPEDGSRLWLRFEPLPHDVAGQYARAITSCTASDLSETTKVTLNEFISAFRQMTGRELAIAKTAGDGSLVLSIKKNDKQWLSPDAYRIETVAEKGKNMTVISAKTANGLLYGVFHLLRLMQTQQDVTRLAVVETPSYERRILNHWENLNGSIERGYAGRSLWDWDDLPAVVSPRYREYARANASVGVNGTVLNNVNANPAFLSGDYLHKAAAIAGVFRPYGIRVYLSVNFSSPALLGNLPTSDPLDAAVKKWWKDKVKEIYTLIPDFGGFLVKANSEGQPGPHDFGRTHVDGANMLAEALEPYNGIVMWRAFVYSPSSPDRAKQAYEEFMPLDGQFHKNVIIQVKNGPVDFQPREPFSPLFGAMQKTPLMIEFQITQEYLGFSKQLAYLAPLFKECLDADTYAKGAGSTVARATDESLFPQTITAIAGVANTGKDVNWCGHHFAQANWYAFGRLAWNSKLSSESIADEWLRMTFTNHPDFVAPVQKMMMDSREAVVNYMMPLGLHHLFAWGHHYGPEPWCNIPNARPDWLPSYYHKADAAGIGFDRTTNGSDAVSQYFPPLNEIYNNAATCPENLILWFHHLPWDYPMKSRRILWDELCYKYDAGVNQARTFQKIWDGMEQYVDKNRFEEVQYKLKVQTKDAIWWKDACLLYFQTFSKRPIPYELERPVNDLEELKQIRLNMTNTN